MIKYNKIILAGGSGYLGQVLADYFSPLTTQIIILSRHPKAPFKNIETHVWDGKTEGKWVNAAEGADMLINLSGKNVNCRYNSRNRQAIIDSRVQPTTLLANVINKLTSPPKLWINITSATIYRHAEDLPQDEKDGEIGEGFSVEVCKAWERCFFGSATPATRKIALRTAIVLGTKDGAYPRILNLAKVGLGGQQGDGEQMVSWIHEADVAGITAWLLEQEEISGVVNCCAPYPVKNKLLMKTIRKTYGIPFGLPSPAWLLKLGALFIGTETELILKSRWVLPGILSEKGYTFKYAGIDDALNNLKTANQS